MSVSFARRALAALTLLVVSSTAAHAGVIYRWVNVEGAPSRFEQPPVTLSGYLDIDADYWSFGGALDAQAIQGSTGVSSRALFFGVNEFYFKGTNHPDALLNPSASLTCADFADYYESCFASLSPEQRLWGSMGGAAVDVDFGLLLRGTMRFSDWTGQFTAASDLAGLWTISRLGSDTGPGDCHASGGCPGATGLWVLDLTTIPRRVPEPASVALLGLALLGLFAVRRSACR